MNLFLINVTATDTNEHYHGVLITDEPNPQLRSPGITITAKRLKETPEALLGMLAAIVRHNDEHRASN